MPDGIGVDVSEMLDLGRDLRAGGARVGAQGSRLLRKTSYDIEGTAKVKAPVDEGTLQNSISTSFVGDGRFGQMSSEIGPTAEHGIYQELGTSRMAAQPYLGPSFDLHLPGFEQAVGQLGGTLLDKSVRTAW